MNKIQEKASLSEKTVQKVARGEVKKTRRTTRKSRRMLATPVKRTHWSDGVDPRIVAVVREMKVTPSCIEVKSSMEVIIHNNPRSK